MKTFNMFKSVMYGLVLTAIAVLLGDANGVALAAAALEGGGTTEGGAGSNAEPASGKGATTLTGEQDRTNYGEEGDEDFLEKAIDEKVTKIRPMSTPIDQISRMADSTNVDQMEFKYFSIGTRPIATTLTVSTGQAKSTAAQTVLNEAGFYEVGNVDMFTADDTFRIVGVKAVTKFDGTAYDKDSTSTPDLICKVIRISDENKLVVHAVNGEMLNGQPVLLPAMDVADTGSTVYTIIRMGKACAELDAQTGRFSNIPTSETQYCQNFMMQVEESTFAQMAGKTVDWNFTDMEEDSVYDMRLGMEGSFLFGDKGKIAHATKSNMYTWFTGGIWWMCGQELPVGTWDAKNSKAVITDEDLVDLSKSLFAGTGCGNKRKIMLCGSDMLAALSKISSDKFRLKDTVEVWNLKFKSWDTDFGEILTMHHELFDLNGMADCAIAIDPEYLSKKKFIGWSRNVLDLKKAGVRNTNAVVLQEASALYLRYPKAHARLKLASAS